MRWSKNFFEYTEYMASNMQMSETLKKEVLLKIPVIHNRYSELEKEDYIDSLPYLKGYRRNYDHTSFEQQNAVDDIEELHPECEKMLLNILEYARQEDIQLVLFAAPWIATDLEKKRLNMVGEIAEQYGGDKFTEQFVSFLRSHYELEDRRGQEGYESWEQNALMIRNSDLRHRLEEAEDINEYLDMLAQTEEDQTVIIALTGYYKALGEVYLEKLMQLGISADDYEKGGIFYIRNKEIELFLPGNEYCQCIKTEQGEIHLESAVTVEEDGFEKNEVQILVNSEPYQMVENGVNIVVYNEQLNKVVDAAGVDVFLGLEVIHNELQRE